MELAVSQHFNMQHPAVGAAACPYCNMPPGSPCVTTRRRAIISHQRAETHVVRVRQWERDALPGEPGSVLPPSPVDTDNDCAP